MEDVDEFREIGHSGGRITFDVIEEDGRLLYSVQYEHKAPVPAAIFSIYADARNGIPVSDLPMGGIGQPWDPPPHSECVPVLIGSDSHGMFGRHCPRCDGYWRSSSIGRFCPYCVWRGRAFQFITEAQAHYIDKYCERFREAFERGPGKYPIDMDAVADAVGKDEKPAFYYAEEAQQNKFRCSPPCYVWTDVLGRFAYCSACGTRNDLAELKKILDVIRERIQAGGPFEACVRDAVSAFDSLAGRYAEQLLKFVPMTPQRMGAVKAMRSFHALRPVREMFLSVFDIDIFRKMSGDDIVFADLMFHRRHVYEHRSGEADEKYISDSGDTAVRPRQLLRETQQSAHRICTTVAHMAASLHDGFHEILPPHKPGAQGSRPEGRPEATAERNRVP
jgi:hypothetical protein